ncbi:MAG: FkbM family methyltransferase [Thermoproteota archaeon]
MKTLKKPIQVLYGILREPWKAHWRLRWFIIRRLSTLPALRKTMERVLQKDVERHITPAGEIRFREIISSWEGVYIDVGAYIGDTLIIAGRAKKIIAIEPVPTHVNELRKIAEEDDRVIIIPMPAGDGGTYKFTHTSAGVTSRLGEIHGVGVVNIYEVKTIKIDDLELPDGPLLIKVDAEGAETMILRGAEETISSRKPVLLIECHGTLRLVEDFLKKHGYKYKIMLRRRRLPEHCHIIAVHKS